MATVAYQYTSGPPEDLEQFARVRGTGFPTLPDQVPGVPFHTQAQPRSNTLEDINIQPREVAQAVNATNPNPLFALPAKFRGTTQRQINQGRRFQSVNEKLVFDVNKRYDWINWD